MKNGKGRLKYYIKSTLNKKHIDQKMIDQCKKNLKEYLEFIGKEDYFYALFSSKLYLKIKDIAKAKKYAEMAQKIDDTKPSLYFLKFKIDVNNKDYENALINLKKFEEILKSENKKLNLSVYYNLLNILLGKEEYKIYVNEIINSDKINDTVFLNLWKKFVTYLIVKDYDKAKLSLKTLQEYLNGRNSDIKLDFNELFILLDNLKTDKNIDLASVLITKINELLDSNDIELADNYFDLLPNLNISTHKEEIKLLNNKIYEKKIDKNITSNAYLNEYRKQCLSYGRLSKQYEDYYNALNYFTAGYYVTNDPIFLYKIAKVYMIRGDEVKAAEYFEKYIKIGYERLAKSYLLLTKLKSFYTSSERDKFMYFYRKTLRTISKITGDSNYYEDNKIIPNNNFDEIFFNEDENFDFNYNDVIENFSNYSSKEKAIALKHLYINGYGAIANKLIKKYRSIMDIEDVQQIEKNKKLYMIKSR